MQILLTYDISNTKNRTKVAALLEGFGVRVNYSVFELDIKKHKLKELLAKIETFCSKEDSVRVYRFTQDTIEQSYDLNKKKSKPFQKRDLYV